MSKRWTMASKVLDDQKHRYSLTTNFKFRNQEIPNLTLNQSLKYLGTAVAARRNIKLQATNIKFDEMKTLVQKIISSPLLTVQKIDAIKTFVIPCFDFLMLNGEISKVHLKEMDSFIRGRINDLLKIPGRPIEYQHMSWRDGGFSIPSLLDRSNVLSICSFAHMYFSKDPNIQISRARRVHLSRTKESLDKYLSKQNPLHSTIPKLEKHKRTTRNSITN
jgi:hypothetical protein